METRGCILESVLQCQLFGFMPIKLFPVFSHYYAKYIICSKNRFNMQNHLFTSIRWLYKKY